jgi:6-phosphogluconate dehydrogenase (decarboxylating)
MATDTPMQLGMVGLGRMGANLHCGPSGAGHFVKMVHNGIEYGMMADIAEGVPALVITTSLYERFESRQMGEYTGKILWAMRSQFGGHSEKGAP